MSTAHEWYALQVRPRCEKAVSKYLRDLGQEEFLPVYVERGALPHDKTEHPLFPGYTFSRIDWNSGPKLYHIPSIIRVVGTGKKPAPITDVEIEAIKQIVRSGIACQPSPFLKPGDPVCVVCGPLAGIRGIVERSTPKRIIVSMPLLRRAIAVSVEPEWLVFCRAA